MYVLRTSDSITKYGGIAQLGERLNGIQEVGGLVWPLLEWVVHRKSDGLGRGEVSHFPDRA